jgi:hypothetical protein
LDKVGDVWVISPTEPSKCENVNKVLFRYVGNGLFCCDDALFENAPWCFGMPAHAAISNLYLRTRSARRRGAPVFAQNKIKVSSTYTDSGESPVILHTYYIRLGARVVISGCDTNRYFGNVLPLQGALWLQWGLCE